MDFKEKNDCIKSIHNVANTIYKKENNSLAARNSFSAKMTNIAGKKSDGINCVISVRRKCLECMGIIQKVRRRTPLISKTLKNECLQLM